MSSVRNTIIHQENNHVKRLLRYLKQQLELRHSYIKLEKLSVITVNTAREMEAILFVWKKTLRGKMLYQFGVD